MREAVRVFVGGGGSDVQQRAVLSRFAELVPPNGVVLSIPWAQHDPSSKATSTSISETLASVGLHRVRQLGDFDRAAILSNDCDAVFLCGGNTFLLLHRLRATGLDVALLQQLRQGLPCYGTSAGAIVLGSHIGTAAHADSNQVGLSDLRGLDLCDGFAIWCHYDDTDAQLIKRYRRATSLPVISLAEDAGLGLDGHGAHAIGVGRAMSWTGPAERNPEPLFADATGA